MRCLLSCQGPAAAKPAAGSMKGVVRGSSAASGPLALVSQAIRPNTVHQPTSSCVPRALPLSLVSLPQAAAQSFAGAKAYSSHSSQTHNTKRKKRNTKAAAASEHAKAAQDPDAPLPKSTELLSESQDYNDSVFSTGRTEIPASPSTSKPSSSSSSKPQSIEDPARLWAKFTGLGTGEDMDLRADSSPSAYWAARMRSQQANPTVPYPVVDGHATTSIDGYPGTSIDLPPYEAPTTTSPAAASGSGSKSGSSSKTSSSKRRPPGHVVLDGHVGTSIDLDPDSPSTPGGIQAPAFGSGSRSESWKRRGKQQDHPVWRPDEEKRQKQQQQHAQSVPPMPMPSIEQRAHPLVIPPCRPSALLAQLPSLHHGVLLVDKPMGWTSFDVVAKIRSMIKFVGVKKVGHCGTLDPLATGLLVVVTGSGTKWAEHYTSDDKEYTGVMVLGQATPSYDSETPVQEELPWEHITDSDLEAVARAFTGPQQQLPPMYSAVKKDGVRLYQLAREGQEVEREPRDVTIHSLQLTRAGPASRHVAFRVRCSKGTYVRTLAHDLGRALGSAAHLTALRREASGPFHVSGAWQLPELAAQLAAAKQEHLSAHAREKLRLAEAAQEQAIVAQAAALSAAAAAAAAASEAQRLSRTLEEATGAGGATATGGGAAGADAGGGWSRGAVPDFLSVSQEMMMSVDDDEEED